MEGLYSGGPNPSQSHSALETSREPEEAGGEEGDDEEEEEVVQGEAGAVTPHRPFNQQRLADHFLWTKPGREGSK